MIQIPQSYGGRGYQEGRVGAPLRDAGWGIARREPTHHKCKWEWYTDGPTGVRMRRRVVIPIGAGQR